MWIDSLFGGIFFTYGSITAFSWAEFSEDRCDPLEQILPMFIQCNISKFGHAAGQEHSNAICYIPFNVLCQYIYIFMWIWIWTLCVLSALYLVFEIVLFLNKDLRKQYLQRNFKKTMMIDDLICDIGDFHFLCLLSKNLDGIVFHEMIHQLLNVSGNSKVLIAAKTL